MKNSIDTVLQFELTRDQVAEAIGFYLASRGLLSELSDAMSFPSGYDAVFVYPSIHVIVDATITSTGFSRKIECVQVDVSLDRNRPDLDPDSFIRKRVKKR